MTTREKFSQFFSRCMSTCRIQIHSTLTFFRHLLSIIYRFKNIYLSGYTLITKYLSFSGVKLGYPICCNPFNKPERSGTKGVEV